MRLKIAPRTYTRVRARIRRGVAAAAAVAFVIGALAATAVRTSSGRHASNLKKKHRFETTEVDDAGPHKHYWDDAWFRRRNLRGSPVPSRASRAGRL